MIIIDTSILIDFIRTKKGIFAELISFWENNEEAKLCIPTVVFYELWAGNSMSLVKETKRVSEFLAQFEVIPLSVEIAKQAGNLKRTKISDGIDAFIAATAIEHNALLATLNTKHFAKIPGLKLWSV